MLRRLLRRPQISAAALGRAAGWSGIGLLLIWAWHLKHPILFALRPLETPLLLSLGLAGAWLQGRRWRRMPDQRRHGLQAALLVLVCLLTLVGEGRYQIQKSRVLSASADMRAAGGHFVIGFTDWNSLDILAGRGLIGGIYLTRRNVAGLSAEELTHRIAHLQQLRAAAGLQPLLVCADQEGGRVSRLAPLVPATAPLSSLAPLGPLALAASLDYGRRQGEALAALGINLNLSPVVDLKPTRPIPFGDLNTQIEQRAIAADPAIVTRIASGYSQGLRAAGVQATLKHFPGLGPVRSDTHQFSARLDLPVSALRQDWMPFREVGQGTDAAIMLGHVILTQIDPDNPVSHSRRVVQGILRNAWRYEGLLLTDDLNMGAVYGEGIGHAASAALNAGVDLVLITYDPDQYYRALAEAAAQLTQGGIDRNMLALSRKRLEARWRSFGPRGRASYKPQGCAAQAHACNPAVPSA